MTAIALVALPQGAAWITLVLLLSVFLAATAWALDALARGTVPSRMIWGGALLVMITVAAVAPVRSVLARNQAVRIPDVVSTMAPSGQGTEIAHIDVPLPNGLRSPMTWSAEWVAGWVGERLQRTGAATRAPMLLSGALLAWLSMSLGVTLVLVVSYRRLTRRIAAESSPARIAGTPVLVTETIGPVVVGVRAPRIVVPHWLMKRPAEEQALVLAHEQSHIAARDPLLLVAGTLGVVLLPWNPFSWWFMSRLRLAIEVDCDRRVLRAANATPRNYGQLLIDLSATAPRISLAAPAFSHRSTHLERRLHTMTMPHPTRTLPRRLSILALGFVALLAACESQIPTATEVAAMDVTELEQQVGQLLPTAANGSRYFIDGVESTREAATALSADQIATIEVRRMVRRVESATESTSAQPSSQETLEFYLTTKAASGGSSNTAERGGTVNFTMVPSTKERTEVKKMLVVEGTPNIGELMGPDGSTNAISFVIIDGVRQDKAAMQRINPSEIASIEIIKGPAAVALYGESAANGVIVLTRKGSTPKTTP